MLGLHRGNNGKLPTDEVTLGGIALVQMVVGYPASKRRTPTLSPMIPAPKTKTGGFSAFVIPPASFILRQLPFLEVGG